MHRSLLGVGLVLAIGIHGSAQERPRIASEVASVYQDAQALYRVLHQHPELSHREAQTAARLAEGLRELGYDVSTGVGGTGVVGVLRNGSGPTAMLRTELDALPVTENTGLPFASAVRVKDATGAEAGVMHACGHDVHMAAWMGTARVMAATRDRWRGTLVLVGQPAEETLDGARAMLADGVLTRFPRPDYALAVHVDARLPAGVVGYRAGPILANMDTVTITIFGRGGHGARPEATVDPIVLAAKVVLALQTIVSRENSPFDPAVVTIGTIHGGTRNNIIPDEVRLELSVRSFTPAVRQRLLAAIDRIAKGEALAAGAPREPLVERGPGATALVNDPDLTRRVATALVREMGTDAITDAPPEMAAEDLAEFQMAGVPTLMLRIGAVNKAAYDEAGRGGTSPTPLHSARFAPDYERTIKSAIAAEVIALRTALSGDSR